MEAITDILKRISYGRLTINDARLYVIKPTNYEMKEPLLGITGGFNKDNVGTVSMDDFAGFQYLRLILRPMYFILRFRKSINHGIVFLDG